MKKRVSIIIPVYNAEKYLHRCVQSILNQSYENWEAIFVNDGSTDSSLSILLEYAEKDHRFKIITKTNGGVSSARNAGLDALQTNFFTFVDADDSISPHFLQRTIEAAVAYDCDLVVTDFTFQGKASGLYLTGSIEMNPSQYVKCVHGASWGKLYNGKIVNNTQHRLRFHEDMKFREDYVFTISYASKISHFHAIAEPMYNYHYEAEDSLMHLYGRKELPFEQYLYCLEAPWRTYRDILKDASIKHSQIFSQWEYVLYNELWKMFYFNKRILVSPDDKKKLTEHFVLRHKDFIPHIEFFKRVCALQRHPNLYKTLKCIWRTVKRTIMR